MEWNLLPNLDKAKRGSRELRRTARAALKAAANSVPTTIWGLHHQDQIQGGDQKWQRRRRSPRRRSPRRRSPRRRSKPVSGPGTSSGDWSAITPANPRLLRERSRPGEGPGNRTRRLPHPFEERMWLRLEWKPLGEDPRIVAPAHRTAPQGCALTVWGLGLEALR